MHARDKEGSTEAINKRNILHKKESYREKERVGGILLSVVHSRSLFPYSCCLFCAPADKLTLLLRAVLKISQFVW